VLVEGLLAEPLSNGRSVKDKVGGFPVLRLMAFRNGRLDLTESKAGAWTETEAAPWIVKEGDFFAARGNGSKHLVGIGALAVGVGTSVAYPDTMIRLAVDREIVDPEYFAAVWNSRVIRDQIESAARTTAGIYKINQPHICGFAFPLPPREEQEVILERIIPVLSQIEHQEAEIASALARISALRQSILKKAFTGQLVPQDSSDEPASALLSRLRATAPAAKTRRKISA
jgi:type I restriction enzyme, S subunit